MKSLLLKLCCLAFLLVLTSNAGAAVAFVQVNALAPQTPRASVSFVFNSAQAAASLNVVVVGWNDTTAAVNSVTDSKGNVYACAMGPTVLAGRAILSFYYSMNFVAAPANGNTVTVQFSAPAVFAPRSGFSNTAASTPSARWM